mmetsp:Transcript_9385/g.25510  ORF Transcript_9385/g.25510 Transcript_9385/m.25510 type:complete len:475 (+) Transcript_9385:871-2295(+)
MHRVRVEEGYALPHDQHLVVAVVVDALRHDLRHEGADHQRRHDAQIVGGLDEQHHNRKRHVRESSQHRRTAHHGVDPRVRHRLAAPADVRGHGLAGEPAEKRADQQVRDEHAHRHRQPWHAAREHEVRAQRDGERTQRQRLCVPREEVLHRTFRRGEQESRHLVVVAVWARILCVEQASREPPVVGAVLADVVEAAAGGAARAADRRGAVAAAAAAACAGVAVLVVSLLQARREQRNKREDDGAHRGVEDHLEDLEVGQILHLRQHPPPDAPHRHKDLRKDGTEDAHRDCEDDEERYVQPSPVSVPMVALLVDQEPVHVRARHVQQRPGHEGGGHRAHEAPKSELRGPRRHGDFLEHVQDRTDGRVKGARDAGRGAQHATDPTRRREALFVDDERSNFGFCVHLHPDLHVWPRQKVDYRDTHDTSDADHGPLAADGETGSCCQDDADGADQEVHLLEHARDPVALQVALRLWNA